jgi:hypothetical protein
MRQQLLSREVGLGTAEQGSNHAFLQNEKKGMSNLKKATERNTKQCMDKNHNMPCREALGNLAKDVLKHIMQYK